MVYQDRLETNLLQLFGHPENSELFSIIFVIIFEVNVVDEQKQRYLANFFSFYKFPLSSIVSLLPLSYRCFGVREYACCVNKLRQNVGLQT